VNLGYLGYLTEIPREDLYPTLIEILSGRYETEERMLLEVRLDRASGGGLDFLALNDVVLAKTALSRVIQLHLSVDGQFVSRYRADGLVVSPPTGSTAYNLTRASSRSGWRPRRRVSFSPSTVRRARR
jgi:NAD+ kinase